MHRIYHINPLNAELNPTRHLLALAGALHFVHVSRLRVQMYRRFPSFNHYLNHSVDSSARRRYFNRIVACHEV